MNASPSRRGIAPACILVTVVVGLAGCGQPPAPAQPPPRPVPADGLEDLRAWKAAGSEGVASAIRSVPGQVGQALRLDFDMAGTGGYAIATRALALDGSRNFEIAFDLRGELPINNLEVKLLDASGKNVWWFHRTDYEYPTDWRRLTIKKRQIEFAWGPTKDKTLREVATLEILVATGKGGGKGWIEVDQLAVRTLPEPTPPPPPRAEASGSANRAPPALAIDGKRDTAWRSAPSDPPEYRPALTIDLGRERDLGGLIIHWAKPWAVSYDVEASRDGKAWRTLGEVSGGNGGADPFPALETTSRYVRLRMFESAARGYAVSEIELVDLDTDTSRNRFVDALAKSSPAGTFPRGQSGQQPYWTVVGLDGGRDSALLSEDGAVELRSGGPSIEPFVVIGGKLTSWANALPQQSLEDRYLPLPSVTWRQPAWELAITPLVTGDAGTARAPGRADLAIRYVLRNTGDAPLAAQLVLAVRPFQVNPPPQIYNIPGGVSLIRELAWNPADGALVINGQLPVRPLTPPRALELAASHAVGFPATPLPTAAPAAAALRDAWGLASAAMTYDLQVPARGETTVIVVAPLFGDTTGAPPTAATKGSAAAAAWFDSALASARTDWHQKLDRVDFQGPAEAQPIIDTLRTSLAYMLLSRDGAILRPGTRCYARAWIRDGAMIGEALLRMGHPSVAVDFLRWFAPYQGADGKVPCCVGVHGASPVPEHDSHGQLIYLAREIYRYTKDRRLLAEVWPRLRAAARYMDQLRRAERTPANRGQPQWGLLAPSISHEGYINPAYSYWDNFWGLRGYRDAAWIASELGDRPAARDLAAQRDEFTRDLRASIDASVAAHQLAFIPGAAEVGDFDATSTTIALAPTNVDDILPRALLNATFERYWTQLVGRHEGKLAWKEYTPYELRAVGTFVRLGWRSRAVDATRYFFSDRRPVAWNQWAEVVGNDPRQPRYIGDMPHAWVHSDYARSALDSFAYERSDDAVVLAAGIPPRWLTGRGISVDRLATPAGPLGYTLSATATQLVLEIDAGAVPTGGFVLPWPYPAATATPGATRINGRRAQWTGTSPELRISERPAKVVIALQRRR